MGDAIVGLYDMPLDVIDLTTDDNGGAEQGSQADDSGIACLLYTSPSPRD